jgi:thiol:disulfide interchange protein DsbD
MAALVSLLAMPAFAATQTATPGESTDFISRTFAKGGVLTFVAAYLAGLAACATPCVYPMIGITVSVFGAKQAKSRRESAMLSALFVLGIAALYVPLGLAVALSGSVWGRALSNPWVSGGLALLFAAMATSMFGAFELSLPSSIQNRLANVGGVGPKGAFLIGLVSGLIASPCTTAPFGAILGSFGTRGVALGTTAVFLFSVGLGTPFFIVGTFAARLPKPGVWMQHIKSFFGIVLLVLALFYAKNAFPALKTVAHRGTTFLWIAIGAVALGLAMGGVHLTFGDESKANRLRKGLGVVLATWGGFALVSWLQMEPSSHVRAATGLLHAEFSSRLHGDVAGIEGATRPVIWASNEEDAKARAAAEKKPMVIDFTADWCAACKEMEKTTFQDSRFWKAASRFVALRIDGTDEDAKVFTTNSKKYEIKGLPAVVILDSSGNPATIFRKKVETDEIISALEKVN